MIVPPGSKVRCAFVTADGETASGSCWMNNPFSYPGAWWRTLGRDSLTKFPRRLEPGEPSAKHSTDFARSGLVAKMDRFPARRDWCVHDVLSPAVPKTTEGEPITPTSAKPKEQKRPAAAGSPNIPATVQR